jgi:putative redox protein
MITTRSAKDAYLTQLSNGKQSMFSDASIAKGGQGAGFGPHELLEAALGTCLNIWMRMKADELRFPLAAVSTRVSLNRDKAATAIFEYSLNLEGPLTAEQREQLLALATTCPVSQTLLREIVYRRVER